MDAETSFVTRLVRLLAVQLRAPALEIVLSRPENLSALLSPAAQNQGLGYIISASTQGEPFKVCFGDRATFRSMNASELVPYLQPVVARAEHSVYVTTGSVCLLAFHPPWFDPTVHHPHLAAQHAAH